tara:strand:+ start:1109 stop:1732 length:624 start_codon:yes stop_codon:yes gene_type:complete
MTKSIIFISGNGSNLKNIINKINSGFINMEIVAVVSNNSMAKGLEIARTNNIDTIVIDTEKPYLAIIKDLVIKNEVSLLILAGYMKILPEDITDEFHGKILNIHPSLLPKHKGLNTHKKVLESNDSSHGASVHFVNSELDGGAVIIQGQVNVKRDDTEETLKEKVHKIEYEIYPIAIKWFIEKHIELKNDKCLFDGEVLECPIEHIL